MPEGRIGFSGRMSLVYRDGRRRCWLGLDTSNSGVVTIPITQWMREKAERRWKCHILTEPGCKLVRKCLQVRFP